MMRSGFTTVEGYFAVQDASMRKTLKTIRQTIKKTVPDAKEVLSYRMPAFRSHGVFVWYAGFKEHYTIFVPRVISEFKAELKPYEMLKSGVKFPRELPAPIRLIAKIVKRSAEVDRARALLKLKKKKG